MTTKNLRNITAHFRFGENWAEFARRIDDAAIAEARSALVRLIGRDSLAGMRFLDIGSGSGLHSLAAVQLGAAQVTAIDIDAVAAATTTETLERFAPGGSWNVEICSVFDAKPERMQYFDVVYSWGVLHHTGAMHEAIRSAAALVAPGGQLCIALYARTALCGFWRVEKRFYSSAPAAAQRLIRGLFILWKWAISSAAHLRHGRMFSLRRHIREYSRARGMNFFTDVHDWLGGYPYESITPAETKRLMNSLGFAENRRFLVPGRRLGLLGSGCDEYAYRRVEGL